ncbi:MAG: hypothetical protein ABIH41_04180 [Nanoarchaeota archaeon]
MTTPTHQARQQKEDPALTTLTHSAADLAGRIRVMEDRYSNLRKKTQLTDQNLIEAEKNQSKAFRGLTEDILGIRRELQDIKEQIEIMTGELDNVVKQHEFAIVRKYLEFWQPMQFVTQDELERMLAEHTQTKRTDAKPADKQIV